MINNHYFLKCANCGYLNKIAGESHSWCSNCTKRFPNYYKLWKNQNKEKNLENYKKEICEKYTEIEIKSFVNPHNQKVEIKNPSKEIIIRRRYIKEGIPLDRGGYTEWNWDQIKKFYIPLLIIVGLLMLLMKFLD